MARKSTAQTSRNPTRLPGKISVVMTVNGFETKLEIAPSVTLLDLLRDHLGLTGTKKGCDHGQCGACTVLVDGRRHVSHKLAGSNGVMCLLSASRGSPDQMDAHDVFLVL